MDKIRAYLEIVPLPVLIGMVIGAGALLVLTPRRLLLPLSLFVLPVWHDLGRMYELGMIQAVAKASSFIAFALIFVAAFMDPSPKRRLPMLVWIYPLYGAFGTVFILSTADRGFAAVIQLQWVFLTLAAIFTVRTITDQQSLLRIVRAIAFGGVFALVVPLTHLLTNPGDTRGLGRFFPWGANPNQIGVLFIYTAPLTFYLALTARRVLVRWILFAIAIGGGFMALLTASRSVLFPLALLLSVIGTRLIRRPGVVVFGAIALLASAGWIVPRLAATNLSRVQSLESGRAAHLVDYLKQEVIPRAATGLLGTTGKTSRESDIIGTHVHNAYAEQFYLFGIPFGGVSIVLAGVTLYATWRVWRRRREVFEDGLLANLLCVMMVCVYAHGFVNSSIYYPTYSWAFIHILLAVLFYTIHVDLKQGGPGLESAWSGSDDGADPYDQYDDDEPPAPVANDLEEHDPFD